MSFSLNQLESTALSDISSATTLKQLEEIELLFLGRKQGELTNFMKTLKDMTPEERKQVGEAANAVKEKNRKSDCSKKIRTSASRMDSEIS
jgi:phenylalanyl-tRNA synthetase alpha chain